MPEPRFPDSLFENAASSALVWLPEIGMGYFPVATEDEPYRNGGAQAYWDKYAAYADTPMGQALTEARVELVQRYHDGGALVDVGIGCGQFLEALHAAGITAYGHDVNEVACAWLVERGLYRNPYEAGWRIQDVTLWDVLEHLEDPGALLERVEGHVFVSLPVFRSAEHAVNSKHFRPDEHRWYWTAPGLIYWMGAKGFELVEQSSIESDLGREDIGTFVFRRRSS